MNFPAQHSFQEDSLIKQYTLPSFTVAEAVAKALRAYSQLPSSQYFELSCFSPLSDDLCVCLFCENAPCDGAVH